MHERNRLFAATSVRGWDESAVYGMLLPRRPPVSLERDLLFVQNHFFENIHFRREWFSLNACGKFAARSVLGLFAPYAGNIEEALVTIGYDTIQSRSEINSIMKGIRSEFDAEGVRIKHISFAQTEKGLMLSLVLWGTASTSYKNGICGAHEGDSIYISGFPGSSGAVREALESPGLSISSTIRNKYLFPDIRLQCGRVMAREMLHSSIIVLNHGLLSGLRTLAETFHMRIVIDRGSLPFDPALERIADTLDISVEKFVLTALPCYELAVTVPRENEARLLALDGTGTFGVSLHRIGICVSGTPEIIVSANGTHNMGVR